MKNRWKHTLALLLALGMLLLCVPAFAADVQSGDGSAKITNLASGVTASFDGADASKIHITYAASSLKSGSSYVIWVVKSADGKNYTISEDTILYMAQTAAAGGSVTFALYPSSRADSLILISGEGLSEPSVLAFIDYADNPFQDVFASDYFYDAVLWAVANGITKGATDTTFAPNGECTRAQIVTFLWRAAGSPIVDADNPFVDVNENDYFYDAVLWAVKNGITKGATDTTFAPGGKCTRAEAVTFLYRARNFPEVIGSNSFTDLDPGAYYLDAVQWAVDTGVAKGTDGTTFSPGQICTRAQIVTFLYRDRTN